jgi:hypothetical protein
MASAMSVYSAEPAFPVLADSLLRQSESSTKEPAPQSNIPVANNDWNLKDDLKKGIQTDSKGVFRCGTVLGFSRLRGRSDETHEYIGEACLTPSPNSGLQMELTGHRSPGIFS